MKKWISWMLCGTLVLSSFLAAGTTYSNQSSIQTSEKVYDPIISDIVIDVGFDGTYECEFFCSETTINNWTSNLQSITIRITINNPWNNTGSHTVWWRIAEYPASGKLWSFLTFLIKHGRVEPVQKPLLFTPYTISWKATDNSTTIIDWTIPIKIVYTDTFVFAVCFADSIFHYILCKVSYVGTGNS